VAKDERLYARFDIAMDEHPKVMLLSDAAFRTLMEVTFFSRRQLTDGFLADGVVRRRWPAEAIAELSANDPERPSLYPFVKGGVSGLMIHDYEKHQTTTADIEAKRDAGRKGGLAKAKQTSSTSLAPATEVLGQKASKPLADPLAERKQTSTAPLAITETETKTKTKALKTLSVSDARSSNVEAAFDAAYARWPKKVERKQALEKFKAASKRIDLDTLAEHIIRFGDAYTATTSKQYTPALGVWIGKERWTDDLPTAPEGDRKPTRTEQNLDFVAQLAREEEMMQKGITA